MISPVTQLLRQGSTFNTAPVPAPSYQTVTAFTVVLRLLGPSVTPVTPALVTAMEYVPPGSARACPLNWHGLLKVAGSHS